MNTEDHNGKVEVVDLRSIYPIDEELVFNRVNTHGKCLVLTEEPFQSSFAQALSGSIQEKCFENLDTPCLCNGFGKFTSYSSKFHFRKKLCYQTLKK